MAFLDEALKLLGLNKHDKNTTFCFLSSNKGLFIEGCKKLYELSGTKITILCESGEKLDILGCDLQIKEISHKEICIRGKINSLNFQ